MRREILYLQDMVEAADAIARFLSGMGEVPALSAKVAEILANESVDTD